MTAGTYYDRAMLRALQDKEACAALSNWSSIADVIHHHESAARHSTHPLTRGEVVTTARRLIHAGLVRRTQIMGEVRYRLTDDDHKALRLAVVG